jgi:hypothetical protein
LLFASSVELLLQEGKQCGDRWRAASLVSRFLICVLEDARSKAPKVSLKLGRRDAGEVEFVSCVAWGLGVDSTVQIDPVAAAPAGLARIEPPIPMVPGAHRRRCGVRMGYKREGIGTRTVGLYPDWQNPGGEAAHHERR